MITNRDRKSFGSRREIPKFVQTTGTVEAFDPRSGILGPNWVELPHVQILMNDWPNPLRWDSQVLSYWFGRNPAVFQDQLVNLNNNLQGGHCFVSSRTRRITGGKITKFKLSHQVLTVEYDGACFPNVSFRMPWISFGDLPCRTKELITAHVSLLLKSRALPDMLPFNLC